jgi:hypothetical protein
MQGTNCSEDWDCVTLATHVGTADTVTTISEAIGLEILSIVFNHFIVNFCAKTYSVLFYNSIDAVNISTLDSTE